MPKKTHLIIGSRGSGLALTQSNWVKKELLRIWCGKVTVEIRIIKTQGDALQTAKSLPTHPGKGLFTKELEQQLLAGKIDLAVHSLKDLPVELSADFKIAAVPKRASARDVLILKKGFTQKTLPKGAIILTGSPRRACQWFALHPHTKIAAIRGNIDTRLKKLATSKDWTGMILAEAGLKRLNPKTTGLVLHPLDFEEMLPAPGQGALGIEIRAGDEETERFISKLNHPLSAAQVTAERAFLAAMGGGCLSPIAAYAEPRSGGKLRLHGVSFSRLAGVRHFVDGTISRSGQLGWRLAQKFQT